MAFLDRIKALIKRNTPVAQKAAVAIAEAATTIGKDVAHEAKEAAPEIKAAAESAIAEVK